MNKSRLYLYIIYIALAAVVLLIASCASDELSTADSGQQGEGRMSLGVNVVQAQDASGSRATAAPPFQTYRMKSGGGKPVYARMTSEARIERNNDLVTRGVSVTSDTFYDRFGLFYYQYDKSKSWADIVAAGNVAPTESNLAVEKSAGWHTDKYWPGMENRITFLAYAPYDNDYKNGSTKYIQLSSSVRGYPTLTYTVPSLVEDQQDLLVSAERGTQDIEGDYNKVVSMKFYHTLSAINFKIGSKMAPGKITKIEVRGIRNKGTYNFGTKEWTGLSGSANYSITPDYIIGDQKSVVFTGIDETKNDLMLVMPQTVPSGAKIVVTIADGVGYGETHEMELPINGHEWKPGYTVTYTFSTSEEEGDYEISVSKISNVSTEAASSVTYKVSSYVRSYYGSLTPVGFKAKYAVDDQIEKGEYSGGYTDVITGAFPFDTPAPSSTTTSFTTGIGALEPPVSDASRNVHTATLRARQEVGTKDNPYDLSTLGDSRTRSTANCYVVGAPGWYKIPLVYGNSIKNGSNNTAVYGTATSKANFVNHLGSKVSNPWLKSNSSVSPADGVLVWQDAYKMIEPDSVFMTSDQMYICFKVNKGYICQGNALLSVRNASKTILWSWHIWVTDEELSSATNVAMTNLQGSVYKFAKVPLGYCETDRRYYQPRKIKFTFEQEKTGKVAEVTFGQSSTNYEEIDRNAPFYQWGRSMPIVLVKGDGTTAYKTLYFANGYAQESQASATSTANSIQHPTTYYRNASNGEWNSTANKLNLWDVNGTSYGLLDKSSHNFVKTIYDPCPVGYKVPAGLAYNATTTSGKQELTYANINASGTFDRGFNFYTQPGRKGSLFFIHSIGCYFDNVGLYGYKGSGYWTASLYSGSPTSYAGAFWIELLPSSPNVCAVSWATRCSCMLVGLSSDD